MQTTVTTATGRSTTHGENAGWTNVNKSFAEGGRFYFRACEVNVSSRTIYWGTCGATKNVTT